MSAMISALQHRLEENPRFKKLKLDATYGAFLAKVFYFSSVKLADDKQHSPATHVEHWAKETPYNPALYFEDRRYTWQDFNEESNRVASVLRRHGGQPDEGVALLMGNRPEYLFTIVGANKVGMVTGLINTQLTGDQLVHALNITRARWLIVGAEYVDALKAVLERIDVPSDRILVWNDPGVAEAKLEGARSMDDALRTASRANPGLDVADPDRHVIYICTSGTTGLPKAVRISNQRYLRAVYYFGRGVLQIQPSDVMYCAGMPLFHNAGISQGWGVTLTNGAAFAFRRKFSVSSFWEDCERYGVTLFTYVGEICRYLLQGAPDPLERMHKLRGMLGAGLRPEIWNEFVERFQIPQVFEYYGATEGNIGLVNLVNREASVGRLLPGHEIVRVDADTEELIRDENGHLQRIEEGESGIVIGKIRKMAEFDGYVDEAKNESKVLMDPFGDGDNYFNSGDLLILLEDRFVAFADRLGDTFRWKGENVSTNDVQAELCKHETMREANVYGVQIPGHDGRAGAVAALVEEGFDVDAFAKHVIDTLPPYARPLFLRLEEELPMTGSYKYVKTSFKREGFDPAQISTPLYFLHPEKQTYVKVTKKLFKEIQEGALRI